MYAYMLIYIICVRLFCACSEPVSSNIHSSQQFFCVWMCMYAFMYVCTCMFVFVRTSMCVFMCRRWTTLSARWVCVKKWATPGAKLLLFVSSVTCIWHRFVCMCGYHALQHTATPCNTLQHTATYYRKLYFSVSSHTCIWHRFVWVAIIHCNTLQHIATHCNTLQRTAESCYPSSPQSRAFGTGVCESLCGYHTLQYIATYSNITAKH